MASPLFSDTVDMKRDPQLFKGTSQAARRLWAEAEKERRLKERREFKERQKRDK